MRKTTLKIMGGGGGGKKLLTINFTFFPTMFSTLSMTNSGHSETFNLPSANAINLVNSSQNDNIFNKSELKTFADDKINEIIKLKFNLKRVENIVGKGEMLVTSIFSFSHNVFKGFFPKVVKTRDCFAKGYI